MQWRSRQCRERVSPSQYHITSACAAAAPAPSAAATEQYWALQSNMQAEFLADLEEYAKLLRLSERQAAATGSASSKMAKMANIIARLSVRPCARLLPACARHVPNCCLHVPGMCRQQRQMAQMIKDPRQTTTLPISKDCRPLARTTAIACKLGERVISSDLCLCSGHFAPARCVFGLLISELARGR